VIGNTLPQMRFARRRAKKLPPAACSNPGGVTSASAKHFMGASSSQYANKSLDRVLRPDPQTYRLAGVLDHAGVNVN
jgi:hypothetical protein